MCQHREHHHGQGCCEEQGSESHCGCGGCGCEGHAHRHYQTKAEQISDLDVYLSELKLEVQAVEERLVDLRG
jgi:hypothetical protein